MIAAEVAGTEYAAGDLHEYLATTDPFSAARASRSEAAEWLNAWVFFVAAEQELSERGVAVTPDHTARAVTDLTRGDPDFVPGAPGGDIATRQRAVVLAALEWTEREIPDVVEAGLLRHLCSRHILVASLDEAADVLARLDAGADFADLAVELSQDPGSGSVGGDLGCVVEGSFVAAFEAAAYAAAPGDAVIAESQFGVHVIEVISSGLPTADNHPQLDAGTLERMAADGELAYLERAQSVVAEQRQQMLAELQNDVFAEYASQVHVDTRYGHWDPEQFAVVASPNPGPDS